MRAYYARKARFYAECAKYVKADNGNHYLYDRYRLLARRYRHAAIEANRERLEINAELLLQELKLTSRKLDAVQVAA